ncbi:MAG: choice-of-anchor D domain-containing protein, partial [Verrucomicrobiota bacterium]
LANGVSITGANQLLVGGGGNGGQARNGTTPDGSGGGGGNVLLTTGNLSGTLALTAGGGGSGASAVGATQALGGGSGNSDVNLGGTSSKTINGVTSNFTGGYWGTKAGGGGAGSSAIGGNAGNKAGGAGGAGTVITTGVLGLSTYLGSNTFGGGGGGGGDTYGGTGGAGGGGNGGGSGTGSAGTAGLGGGGGASGHANGGLAGGVGGAGSVAIQYAYNNNVAAGTLTLSGGITLNSTSTLDAVRSGGLVNVTSAITGAGGLNIASSALSGGVVQLSAANTYTGATTVSGGKLSVASTGNISTTSGISIGAAELNYNSSTALTKAITFSTTGGKLSGNGTITPAVTISAGNTLAPGNSIGTLSFGTGLTIAGTYSVELGTAGATASSGLSDRAAVTGNLTLTGSTLSLVDNAGANSQGSAGAGAYRIATFTGTRTGTFGTVTNPLSASLHEVVSYGTGVVDLSLYRLATATAPGTSVNLGNARVGGTLAGSASVTNSASSDGFSELLKATVTGDGTGFSGVAGGANGTVNYSLSTATAGSKSGSASVVLKSTGVGTYGDTTLNTTSVDLSGGVYNAAAANILSAVNLGKIRAGGSFGSSALTITNTSAAGAYTEGLNATKGSTTGDATVSGTNISNLAGASSSTAISVGLGSGNMTAGAYTGNVSIGFASNGTNSSLSDLGLNSQSLTVTGAVYDYATADFTQTAGVGALTKTNTYSYTFNFGSGLALNTNYTATFSLANGALNVEYKDALGGSYSSIANGFSTTAGAFGTNTSNSLAAGGSNSFDITFNSGTGGLFNETLTFSGLSQQSGLADASLGDYTFALSATAVPEPDVAVLVGGLGMLTLLRRRRA